MKKLSTWMLIAAFAATLAFSPVALAAESTQSGYGPTTEVEIENGSSTEVQDPPAGGSGSGGFLPFTGLDLGFVILGGVTLLIVGVSLRRLTRRPGTN